ncbi:CAP domain-containing protein [Bradyrhizobium sp. ISRA436]|uniref:CAP domain-containing protein n=1 Tax=unclassified Bradyrhizobium TaxID=2631580 RepID=UPI00247B2D0F|nr:MULTISPECIES: CAP domain-containing protein [unclassified Bradyrhizobium]WGR94360.1 CAP domain-containing protein [Bradyrhizobium sp. ISRA435]WGR99073.1 CAP domain-containing protein [Bradyrhizobium sp. ISRA436]WGS05964.1 CAP domain-containing protein [Bradyrhizobium sp. ISRA437]
MKLFVFVLGFVLGLTTAASAADYAGAISAYRRAHGMSRVRLDARLNAMALRQARTMSATGSVNHSAGGSFFSRIAPLKKQRAAENIGAGFIAFAEMLRQWQSSAGDRENLLMPGAKRVGVAFVDNAKSPYRRFWAMVISN